MPQNRPGVAFQSRTGAHKFCLGVALRQDIDPIVLNISILPPAGQVLRDRAFMPISVMVLGAELNFLPSSGLSAAQIDSKILFVDRFNRFKKEMIVSIATATTELRSIRADVLAERLGQGAEIAVIDVRPHAAFLAGHILRSVSVLLGHIEVRISRLVPRLGTEIVLVDGATGLAGRAAARLAELGYTNISVLEGGLDGWSRAGRPLISGQHAISKALGEYVEREQHTPRLTAEDLQRRRDAGENIVVLDTRPIDEYSYVAIPGSVAAPGAELLYRFDEIVKSPETTVVVTCAGRTRGIIGAQALLNAGITNPVYSLENGTSGWEFVGFEPWRAADDQAPLPGADSLAKAADRADALIERFAIATLDAAQLAKFRAEADIRTLYLFDVRTVEEYQAGHLRGAQAAPGGQLVQTTDLYVGTNGARIVLVDGEDGVRGAITASWLLQLGIGEVFLHRAPATALTQRGGDDPVVTLPLLHHARFVRPVDVAAGVVSGDVTVIDFGTVLSGQSHRRVIEGSWYATRHSLPGRTSHLPGTGPVLLVSSDGAEAAFAANDLLADGRDLLVLEGGIDAWALAGLPLLDTHHAHSLDADGPPNRRLSLQERKAFFADYVAWGDTIVDKIRADGTLQLGGRA